MIPLLSLLLALAVVVVCFLGVVWLAAVSKASSLWDALAGWVSDLVRRLMVDKGRPLKERVGLMIEAAEKERCRSEADVVRLANRTLEEMMRVEGRTRLIHQHVGWPPEWTPEFKGLKEWIELKAGLNRQLLDAFHLRQAKERAEAAAREAQRRTEALEAEEKEWRASEAFWEKHKDLFLVFMEVAERKAACIDLYGDVQIDEKNFSSEVKVCCEKLSRRIKASKAEGEVPRSLTSAGRLSSTPELSPSSLEPWLRDKFQRHLERQARRAPVIAEVDQMSGTQFELWIAQALKQSGFENVRGTPASGDQGADIIAEKGGRRIVIQAKRHKNSVGNKAVQEVASAVSFYRGDEGWVVTSSHFTPAAIALARSCGVKLIDRHQLSNPANWGQ